MKKRAKKKTKTKSGPWKLGRNDPCSCGSGLKFKKCCLPKVISPPRQGAAHAAVPPRVMASKDGMAWKVAPPELHAKAMRMFEGQRRKEQQRVARFGHIRPQISMVWQGQRWVIVRNKLFYKEVEK